MHLNDNVCGVKYRRLLNVMRYVLYVLIYDHYILVRHPHYKIVVSYYYYYYYSHCIIMILYIFNGAR